jgi:hypothetical protein
MGWFDGWFGSPTPAPSGAKPPPPATTKNASATQPQQECPHEAKHPCDVNKLMIKVTGIEPKKGDEQPPFKLETTKVRRLEPVTDVKSSSARTLLKQADLLIDVFGEPKGSKVVEIEGRAYYTSPDCETQSHSLLTMEQRGKGPPEILKKIGASEIEMPSHKYPAMVTYLDALGGDQKDNPLDNVTSIFKIVETLLETVVGHMTEVTLRADACGKRAKGDGGNLNQMLIAHTRIYRRTKWSIGLKIPPLGKWEEKREGTRDVTGLSTTTSKSETSAGFNYARNESTQKTSSQAGTSLLNTSSNENVTQRGGQVDSTQTSRGVDDGSPTRGYETKHSDRDGHSAELKDGHVTSKDIEERLERESGFELIISVDDREITPKETVNKVKEYLAGLAAVINHTKDIFEKAPQIGWKFSFEVSVFEGSLTLSCEPEYVAGPLANGRYYPIQYKFSGKIELKIFDVTLKVSFGVDAQALDSGLTLKVEGKISIECKIDKEINADFFSPKQEIGVEVSADAKLSIVGYVSVLGKTLADAELSLSSGLEFKDGKLEIDVPERKCHLTGKLKTKPITLKGKIRCPYWWDKTIDPPKELLPEHELCSLD